MAYVDKLNVNGSDYDIQDKRLPESAGTIQIAKPVNVGNNFTADNIVENMSGYSFVDYQVDTTWTPIYSGIVKNGNKLTFVIFGTIEQDGTKTGNADIGVFNIPSGVGSALYPYSIGQDNYVLDQKEVIFQGNDELYNFKKCQAVIRKNSNSQLAIRLGTLENLTQTLTYCFRIEVTFLLSDNLAA